MKMKKSRAPWPDCYYEETDPFARLALLREAIEKGEGEAQENAARLQLWEKRYAGASEKSKTAPDGYVGLWVTMMVQLNDIKSRMKMNRAAKELARMLEKLGANDPLEEPARTLQAQEWVHAMEVYLSTCSEGSYSTQLFGMMRIKKDRLEEKIAYDVYRTAYELPQKLQMGEQFGFLQRAAGEALKEMYPASAELLSAILTGEAEL